MVKWIDGNPPSPSPVRVWATVVLVIIGMLFWFVEVRGIPTRVTSADCLLVCGKASGTCTCINPYRVVAQ